MNPPAWYDPAWKYRKAIRIDPTRVSGETLRDFPVLISLQDPLLGNAGGHVARPGGEDLLFAASDGTALDHEIAAYDPATGALRAWVRVPALSHSADTVLYLYYGNPAGVAGDGRGVWDPGYRIVLHMNRAEGVQQDATFHQNDGTLQKGEAVTTRVGSSDSLKVTDTLTVEAWVSNQTSRAEALQAVVSKWALSPALEAFDAYDAGDTDGLTTKGFFGAVFDGRYVYFVPQNDGAHKHGRVLRYDTHGPFGVPESWSAYDAGDTDGLSTKGYYGAVATKHHVYFVPRTDDAGHHTRLLRYDRAGDFKAPGSWQAFDVGNPISYQSGAYDGRYIYFSPGYEHPLGPSGKVMRHDTRGALDNPKSYAVYDAVGTSGLDAKCYDGAVFDGRYVYFAPLNAEGIVLRCDTQGDFLDGKTWTAYDASRTSGLKMGMCVGAIFDGRYIYYVPYASSVAVRYDTRGGFTDPKSWIAYEAGDTSGLDTRGYDGAAFDGKYITYFPFWEGDSTYTGFHGKLLRYDTQKAFTDRTAWDACDAGDTGGIRPVGFNGGAFDGRFIYFAPWREGTTPDGAAMAHGRVLRYDTTGSRASFSLRYMDCGHNGGLCAALPGPAFLVNTDRGVLGARADRNPTPGTHHLAGVYDGKKIRLFIDGVLEREEEGAGRILTNDSDLTVGRIQDGLGYFDGRISEVRVSGVARSAGWIRTGYDNQRSPSEFFSVGEEEKVQG